MGNLANVQNSDMKKYASQSKIKKWSREWYKLATREELIETLKEAKQSLDYVSRMEQPTASLMWGLRLEEIQKELIARIDPGN